MENKKRRIPRGEPRVALIVATIALLWGGWASQEAFAQIPLNPAENPPSGNVETDATIEEVKRLSLELRGGYYPEEDEMPPSERLRRLKQTKADRLMYNNKLKEAIQLCQELIENPQSSSVERAEASATLAECYRRSGRNQEALQIYQMLATSKESMFTRPSPDGRYYRFCLFYALSLHEVGRCKEAFYYYQHGKEGYSTLYVHPLTEGQASSKKLVSNIYIMYAVRGTTNQVESQRFARAAIRLRPNDPMGYNALIHVLSVISEVNEPERLKDREEIPALQRKLLELKWRELREQELQEREKSQQP
jgi:tetratricopeptide (TPR) repeat protein